MLKPKTKLRKRASDEADSNSFSFLRIVGRQRRLLTQKNSSNPSAYEGTGDRDRRPWRYGVDIWLRSNLEHHHNSGSRHTYGSGPSTQYGTATEGENGTKGARHGALGWLCNVPADIEAPLLKRMRRRGYPPLKSLKKRRNRVARPNLRRTWIL